MHARARENTRMHRYVHVLDGIDGATRTYFQRNRRENEKETYVVGTVQSRYIHVIYGYIYKRYSLSPKSI